MSLLADFQNEFQRYKTMADKAMASVNDDAFFQRPNDVVNSIALIVKHIAGNFASRWSEFLTTDGEKSNRNRDGEFVIDDADTRSHLMSAWERGWSILFATLSAMKESDLEMTVKIRGEAMTARLALLRGVEHTAYHVGQILYLARLLKPDSPWLTIAPAAQRTS